VLGSGVPATQLFRCGDLPRLRGGAISVVLPSSLATLGPDALSAFWKDRSTPADVTFAAGCRLRQIDASTFARRAIHSIHLPASVEVLCRSCFEHSTIESITFEPDSRLATIDESCFAGSRMGHVTLPRSVKVLGGWCFEGSSVESLDFEPGSQLARVEEKCFEHCALPSLSLPPSIEYVDGSAFVGTSLRLSVSGRLQLDGDFLVDTKGAAFVRYFGGASACIRSQIRVLGKSAFEQSAVESVTFERNSQLRTIDECCFRGCSLKAIRVPKSVEVLGRLSFMCALDSLSFETSSRLARIEEECFRGSSLVFIRIPASVDFIDGSAFVGSAIRKIEVARGNTRFRVDRDFLVDGRDAVALRYIGPGGRLRIWKELRVLGKLCCEHAEIEEIEFEDGGRLAAIDEMCFWFSTITNIRIPRSVQVLRDSCFMHAKIAKVEFEPRSGLVRIEENCFQDCPLTSVVIPAAVEFVAENAFPDVCLVDRTEPEPPEAPKEQPNDEPKEESMEQPKQVAPVPSKCCMLL
jgi:hypothetical protein